MIEGRPVSPRYVTVLATIGSYPCSKGQMLLRYISLILHLSSLQPIHILIPKQ
jgi:hypothetical protein